MVTYDSPHADKGHDCFDSSTYASVNDFDKKEIIAYWSEFNLRRFNISAAPLQIDLQYTIIYDHTYHSLTPWISCHDRFRLLFLSLSDATQTIRFIGTSYRLLGMILVKINSFWIIQGQCNTFRIISVRWTIPTQFHSSFRCNNGIKSPSVRIVVTI